MIRFLLLFPLLLFAVPWVPTREPIDPHISGDTFRAHSDFAYDELDRSFNPESIPPKATIFTTGDFLDEFFEKVHPRIQVEYILVVHNTDRAIPGRCRVWLDDPKLLALFSQNLDGTLHPKLHPLPIGLENRQWNRQNWETLKATREKNLPKTHLVYCNFAKATFPEERELILRLVGYKPYSYTCQRKPYPQFTADLASSKFVLSPRGNGLDTHRLWETLLAGSYPIVKSSPIDALYEGLPVVVVKRWEEVTEEFLEKKFEELSQRTDYDWEKLSINYYLKQIDSYK
jgi:hypothetical protein